MAHVEQLSDMDLGSEAAAVGGCNTWRVELVFFCGGPVVIYTCVDHAKDSDGVLYRLCEGRYARNVSAKILTQTVQLAMDGKAWKQGRKN